MIGCERICLKFKSVFLAMATIKVMNKSLSLSPLFLTVSAADGFWFFLILSFSDAKFFTFDRFTGLRSLEEFLDHSSSNAFLAARLLLSVLTRYSSVFFIAALPVARLTSEPELLSANGLHNLSNFELSIFMCWQAFFTLDGRHWAAAPSPASSPANDLSSVTAVALWVIVTDYLRLVFSEFLNATIPRILDGASLFSVCSSDMSMADLL